MAGDTFTVDSAAFEAAAQSLKALRAQTSAASGDMRDMLQHLNAYGKLRDSINKSMMVKPEERQELNKLGRELKRLSVSRQAMAKASAKEIVDYRNLSMLDKARVRLLQAQAAWKDKETKSIVVGGKMLELQGNLMKRSVQQMGSMVSKMKGVAESAAGFEFSVMGVIRLLFELENQQRRLGGLAMQTAAQWGSITEHSGKAQGIINRIADKFSMTTDAAGALVNEITRQGIKEKDAERTIEDMKAIEEEFGVAVQQTTGFVNELKTSYGLTDAAALTYQRTAMKTAEVVEGMTMEEVISDMQELTAAGRAYKVDLLDVLSMYNLLMRKDMAKSLGLGEAPLKVRKEIGKTVMGFNQELDDGWKAALGSGATAAAKILNFEKLASPEQFVRMAKMMRETTSGFVGDEREYAVRQLLKQFGFTTAEVNKTLAEAFTSGGFDTDGLERAMRTLGEEKDKLGKAQNDDANYRGEVLKHGANISDLLRTWGERVQLEIRKSVVNAPQWPDLKSKLEAMQSAFIDKIPAAVDIVMNIYEVLDKIASLAEALYNKFVGPSQKDIDRDVAARKVLRQREDRSLLRKLEVGGLSEDNAKKVLNNMLPEIFNKNGRQMFGGMSEEDTREFDRRMEQERPGFTRMGKYQQETAVTREVLERMSAAEVARLVEEIRSNNTEEIISTFKNKVLQILANQKQTTKATGASTDPPSTLPSGRNKR